MEKQILKSDSFRENHEKTMEMIYEKMQRTCNQPSENAKEIYLLSLALKELTQLEPTKQ